MALAKGRTLASGPLPKEDDPAASPAPSLETTESPNPASLLLSSEAVLLAFVGGSSTFKFRIVAHWIDFSIFIPSHRELVAITVRA